MTRCAHHVWRNGGRGDVVWRVVWRDTFAPLIYCLRCGERRTVTEEYAARLLGVRP